MNNLNDAKNVEINGDHYPRTSIKYCLCSIASFFSWLPLLSYKVARKWWVVAGGSDVVMLQLILFPALFLPLEHNKLKYHQGICILKLVSSNLWSMVPISNAENCLPLIFHDLNSVFCTLLHFLIILKKKKKVLIFSEKFFLLNFHKYLQKIC